MKWPLGVAVAVLAAAPCAPGQEAPREPLFDPARLHVVQIEIDPADWAALQAGYWSNQFYAADVALDGEVVRQVGVRSRGDGSRNERKPGLKLDFNRHVPGQEHHGYKSLVLDNLVQDPSGLREALAFEVFEAMGLAAPQAAFARVHVNGAYHGLYGLVEPVSGHLLNERFGEDGGNLFDYEWVDAWRFEERGDAAAYVPAPFQPESTEQPFDPGALLELVHDANAAPGGFYLEEIAQHLDPWRLATYLAVENAVAERDGFVGAWGVNNLYFYQFRGQRRFVLIPWDKDSTFAEGRWPVEYGLADNVLTRGLMADARFADYYRFELKRAAVSFVNERWLLPRLESRYALIREAMLADPAKPYSNEQFEDAVVRLRTCLAEREANVLEQVP